MESGERREEVLGSWLGSGEEERSQRAGLQARQRGPSADFSSGAMSGMPFGLTGLPSPFGLLSVPMLVLGVDSSGSTSVMERRGGAAGRGTRFRGVRTAVFYIIF